MTTPRTYIIDIAADGRSRVTLRRKTNPDAYADVSAVGTQHVIAAINAWLVGPLPLVASDDELYDECEATPASTQPLALNNMFHAANVVWGQVDLALDELHGIEKRLEDAKDLLATHIVTPLEPDEEE